MNIFHTIIIGAVEGITEFLPVSSTAHMDIARHLLSIVATDFVKSFEIIIQLGAILAVLVLYWKRVFINPKYLIKIMIAFVPTGVIGFILYKLIKSFLLGNIWVEGVALLIGGVIILLFEKREEKRKETPTKKEIEDLSIKDLMLVGVAQALAVIPGVSRSGAIIISGRAMDISKTAITEFSFLLAVPTMLAATVYDVYKSGFAFGVNEWGTIALGFLVSFLVALFSVKWLINYIKNHTFSIFGWYRVIVGSIILILFVI